MFFYGKRKLEIAACKTVCLFNTAATSIARLMRDCRVTPGRNALMAFSKRDSSRLRNAAIKISKKYKDRLKQLRASQKHFSEKENESYISGGFGLTSTPEYKGSFDSRGRKQNHKKMSRKRLLVRREVDDNQSNEEPKIQFVLPLIYKFKVYYK